MTVSFVRGGRVSDAGAVAGVGVTGVDEEDDDQVESSIERSSRPVLPFDGAFGSPPVVASASELAEQIAAALARGSGRPRLIRDPQSIATFSAGELLADRYVVERFLARGGMGEVYLALDRERGRRVAIKTVLSTQGDDVRAVRRLLREVRLASSVRHANVCRVHGAGVHAPSPRDVVHFMTMDFIDGPSLRAWRQAVAPSLPLALHVARQMLLGLDAIHAAGVIHGDLKSDNVMIADDAGQTRAVVIDFGLSQRLDGSEHSTGVMRSGSFGYMAPEQIAGEAICSRTDIFSFGVVLFELLTGALPFPPAVDSDSIRAGVARITRALLPGRCPGARASDLADDPGLPSRIQAVIARCLSYRAAERFATALETLDALDACLA